MSPPAADAAAELSAERAPPPSFPRWVTRQALLAALPIALVLAGLCVRRAARPVDEVSDLRPWRLWVRVLPSSSPTVIDGVAVRRGVAARQTHTVAFPVSLSDGTTTRVWQILQVPFIDTNRLVGTRATDHGSYALVGPVVAADGASWQEAWRNPLHESVRIADSDRSAAGTWTFVGETGFAGMHVLAPAGTHDGNGGPSAQWASRDGLLVVQWREPPPAWAKRKNVGNLPHGQFMVGTLSDDGRGFEGIDWLGRPVTGRKVK